MEPGGGRRRGMEAVGGAVLGLLGTGWEGRPGRSAHGVPWVVMLSRGELDVTFPNPSISSVPKRKFSVRKRPRQFLWETRV